MRAEVTIKEGKEGSLMFVHLFPQNEFERSILRIAEESGYNSGASVEIKYEQDYSYSQKDYFMEVSLYTKKHGL